MGRFRYREKFRTINIAKIADELGEEKCKAILAFHALTGCDTTSKFAGRGKVTCWATWTSYPEVTPALCVLSRSPMPEDVDAVMPLIERFVVLLYDRCSDETEVNKSRLSLFAQKNRDLDNIPPTQDALKQHVLRAAYQADHVWGRALEASPQVPDLRMFGWTRRSDSDSWKPLWITQPTVREESRELIRCKCKVSCSRMCKCVKADLPCTHLCSCDGCDQDSF